MNKEFYPLFESLKAALRNYWDVARTPELPRTEATRIVAEKLAEFGFVGAKYKGVDFNQTFLERLIRSLMRDYRGLRKMVKVNAHDLCPSEYATADDIRNAAQAMVSAVEGAGSEKLYQIETDTLYEYEMTSHKAMFTQVRCTLRSASIHHRGATKPERTRLEDRLEQVDPDELEAFLQSKGV